MPNGQPRTRTNARSRLLFGIRHSALGILTTLAAAGCFAKPNKANIALRKEIQSLTTRMSDLESRHAGDTAQIAALQTDRTIQTLSVEKMRRLFTCSGIRFKRILVGEDLDPQRPGDEGFKIGLVPIDQFRDEFKSAGSIRVELFDLAQADTRLGEWSFSTPDTQPLWSSSPVFDGYVLRLSWQTPPQNARLLVKATFVEELTGRSFDATAELTVKPPAAP